MNNILGVSYPGVLHPVVSHGASERLTEADQNWLQCRLMLILMFDFYDDGLYRRWCWCWWCGYGGYRCWSLSQKSYDFHLQAILTHFLSPEFVLRTVVSKIYNALLISESSCSKEHLNDTLPPLGVYSCVAGNILGETVSQAFLQVVWMSLNIFG